jgi:glycosyltransferase involved in cell wall biosynthesis
VFCLPTRFEPFGIAFLEAMHWGLPCVGTDTGAVAEMIVDGDTGYAVPPDDVDALERSLCRLLRDRQLARRMGNAGRARVLSHFTWPAVVDRMSRVLAAVAPPRAAGGAA